MKSVELARLVLVTLAYSFSCDFSIIALAAQEGWEEQLYIPAKHHKNNRCILRTIQHIIAKFAPLRHRGAAHSTDFGLKKLVCLIMYR